MADRPELSKRKATVLHAVVEAYVATGEPVGSETIAERAHLGVSSATIRNEMSSLEEQGYLSHPHTSAGRIPTDAGYRHYVNALPVSSRLKDAQRRQIARTSPRRSSIWKRCSRDRSTCCLGSRSTPGSRSRP